MVGFIFGGNTGISSPQELERRRAIADMLASGAGRAPKDVGEGLTAIGQALAFRMMDRRNRKDAEAGRAEGDKAFASLFSMFGGGQDTQAPEMAGGSAVSPSTVPQTMDYPSQRVAQAFGDAPASAGGGEIESYIRTAAKARGIDPDVAIAVAKSEGGLKDPFRQSDIVKNGVREQSYGPFQLYMGGGLGNKALEKGIDPRKDWKAGIDFALDQAAQGGWGPWYGAKKIGVTGMHGIGQSPAPQALSAPSAASGNWSPGQPMPTMPLGPGAAPQGAPMPEMAGGAMQVAQNGGEFPMPPQPPQQGGDRLQMLMQAAQNPWLSPEQKGIVNMMLQQEMAKMDPNAGLDAEYKRMQIKKLESDIATANSPDARKKFGLNPQYGVDANGNPVLLQLGADGSAQQTQLPPGVTLSKEPLRLDAGTHWVLLDPITRQPIGQIQKNVAGEASATETGKAQGQAQAGLGSAEAGYNTAVEQIDAILNHPGLNSSVGTIQGRIPDALAGAMNSDVADFRTRVGQLQGQTFLRAFEALKGGGAITEIEGKKAEQAIGRLNQAVSEDDFKAALSDLRSILDRGIDAYRRKAGVVSQPADGWQDMGGGVRMRVKQ